MAEQVRNLIAKWSAAWPSPLIISRQRDNGQFRINLVDYPEPENYEDQSEEVLETISYYLTVWMKQTEDGEIEKLAPIQLPGPYWKVYSPYTQLVQCVKFQFYATSSVTGYIGHSAIFTGLVLESLEEDGEDIGVIPAEMWDAYKQYIEDKIIAAGVTTIDPTLSIQGAAADAKAAGDAITELNERLDELGGGVPSDIRQALVTLAKAAIYKPDLVTDETGETPYNFTAEFALLEAWASTTVTAITLSESSISFSGTGTKKLTATLTPSDAEGAVRWSTSNPNVASVSSNGTVTAVGNGSCIIAASVGNVTANCSVTVSGVALMRTVTNTLTGCTNSNSAATVADGGSYTGTLTASSGYTMTGATVTVLMGGIDVTSTAYSNGTISIANVTGNIEITAVAEESPLYSFENGTYTFSNGHSVTVEDGNIVTGVMTSSNQDLHANISSVSENTSTSNAYASNYVSGTTKLFTIPAGATVHAEVTPLQITGSNTVILGKNCNMRLVKQASTYDENASIGFILQECKYNSLTVGNTVESDITVEDATDVYTVSMWNGHSSGATMTFKAEVKIYVNGVRFI